MPGGCIFVPLGVDFGHGMNVVRSLIVVDDLEFLVGVHDQNVRKILAAFPLEVTACAGTWPSSGASDETYSYHVIRKHRWPGHNGFGRYGCGMLLGTTGVFGHVDGLLWAGVPV